MGKMFVYVSLRGLGALAGFFVTLLVAKTLPSDISAVLFVFMSLILSVAALSRLGADVHLLREASYAFQRGDKPLAISIFATMVAFSFISSVVGILLFQFVRTRLGPLYQEFSTASVAIGVFGIVILYLSTEMLKAMLYLNASILLQSLLPYTLISCFVLLVAGFPPDIYVLYPFLTSGVVAIVVAAILMLPFKLSALDVINYRQLKGVFTYAPKAVIAYLYPQLPILLAGLLFYSEAVEALAVLIKISMAVALPIVAINAFYSSLVARAFAEQNYLKIKRYLYRSQFWCGLAGGSLMLAILFKLDSILQYFELSMDYALPMKVLLLGQFVNAITGPASVFSAMMKLDRLLSFSAVGLLTLFGVGIFFSEGPGVMSIVVSFSLALIAENLFVYYFTRKHLDKLINQKYFPQQTGGH